MVFEIEKADVLTGLKDVACALGRPSGKRLKSMTGVELLALLVVVVSSLSIAGCLDLDRHPQSAPLMPHHCSGCSLL